MNLDFNEKNVQDPTSEIKLFTKSTTTRWKHKLWKRSNIINDNEEKDLGVYLDKHLSFDSCITTEIWVPSHIWINQCFFVYNKSLIRPRLEYASPVWLHNLKKHQIAIEEADVKATKILPNEIHVHIKYKA